MRDERLPDHVDFDDRRRRHIIGQRRQIGLPRQD
jgi:hypothetical protein